MSAAAPGNDESRGLWDTLAGGATATPARASHEPSDRPDGTPDGVDVWACLADQLDLGAYIPTPSPQVEAREVAGRDGRRLWVLRSPSFRYLRLDATDLDLWQRMDGQRNV